ncbi:hypothetical protein Y710_18605 [Gordonia sp. QH-12]|nr:hypothetical protein Y710_18605 [Gordonia sp. QH-12]
MAADLVTDLLGLVEVTLPTITAQRDDALAEVEKLRAGRVADVELVKASWRDITEAAGLAWRDDDPSMVPGLIESIADLRAGVERVRVLAAVWDKLGAYDLPSAPYAPGFAAALRKALDGEDDRG